MGVTNGYEYGEAFDANTKIKRDAANQDDLGFKKLQARRFEYMVSFEKVADSVFAKDPSLAGKFKRIGVAADAHLYLVFSRKHPDGAKYLERFNAGFEALGRNGSYRSLEAKWL